MAQRVPRDRSWLDRWLRRVDQAADTINPLLALLAIGLAVLDLTCFALLATRLAFTHCPANLEACPLPAPAAATETPTRDLRAWGTY